MCAACEIVDVFGYQLLVDAEYRRSWDDAAQPGISQFREDSRGWYLAGSYQILKRVRVGTY